MNTKKQILIAIILALSPLKPILAMEEVVVRELSPDFVRTRFLDHMRRHTQLPAGQSNEDRVQAILNFLRGGAESKENINACRKTNIDLLEHIHTEYQDDEDFAPIINALDGQLMLLDAQEQLVDNLLDAQLWDQLDAICGRLIVKNIEHSSIVAPFIATRDAFRIARQTILARTVAPKKNSRSFMDFQAQQAQESLQKSLSAQLIKFAQKGNSEAVQQLIAAGAEMDTRDSEGHTALDIAIRNGHQGIVFQLLKEKANSYTNSRMKKLSYQEVACKLLEENGLRRWTPWEGHDEVVCRFLTANPDNNKTTEWYESALNLAAGEIILNQQLIKAVLEGNYKAIQQLIEAGANVNPPKMRCMPSTEKCECLPLHLAALEGFTDVCKLLIDAGADVNSKNCFGQTALHHAAWQGHKDSVCLLLDAKADINELTDKGENALGIAARRATGEWLAITEILIHAKARLYLTTDAIVKHQKAYSYLSSEERQHKRLVSPFLSLVGNTTNREENIHPLCDLFVQKLLEVPNCEQTKRIITLLCCLKKHGAYRDIFALLKAPLLKMIIEENQQNPESLARYEIDQIGLYPVLRDKLLKKYAKKAEWQCAIQ